MNNFETATTDQSYFISLEGIEAAGKSTQIDLIKSYLEKSGFEVTILREPGGTEFGEKLRSAILSGKKDLHPIAEAYLFAASRSQLLHEKILPTLNKPKQVVICDRYIDSSIAYQGVARGLGVDTVLDIHSKKPLNILPHLTFYIKISIECSLKRQAVRNNEKDYFEKNNNTFYEKLVSGYDQAAELFPDRIKIIDGETDIETMFKAISNELERFICE